MDLNQIRSLLNDVSSEKENELLRAFLERSGQDSSDEDDDMFETSLSQKKGKIVLFERKGVKSDLFTMEKYIEDL